MTPVCVVAPVGVCGTCGCWGTYRCRNISRPRVSQHHGNLLGTDTNGIISTKKRVRKFPWRSVLVNTLVAHKEKKKLRLMVNIVG